MIAWLEKRRKDIFSLSAGLWKDLSVKFSGGLLLSEFKNNSVFTVEELTQKVNSSHSTFYPHLQELGNVPNLEK